MYFLPYNCGGGDKATWKEARGGGGGMGVLCTCWLVTTPYRGYSHDGNRCYMAPSGPQLVSVAFHRNVQVREIKDILLAILRTFQMLLKTHWLHESVSYNGSWGREGGHVVIDVC